MEKRSLKLIVTFFLIVTVLFVVLNCSKKSKVDSDLPTVKLNIVTWPGYGPIYLAQEKGFFEDEGVEVECKIQENTQARRSALVAGEIDLIGITLESVVLANAENLPMQVVGISDISDGGDGIVASKSIKSISDLKGKRVAFPEGQPSHLFLLYHLDKVGLTPEDIVPVYTDNAGKAGEIFAAGQVDAAVTWEPWLSTASESGKGNVLVTSAGAEDILIGIFAANRKFVEKNQEKLQKFFRGWYKGLEYVLNNKEESIPIMAKGFQLPPEEFAAIMEGLRFIDKDEAKQMLIGDGTENSATFYKISEYEENLWKKSGLISKDIHFDSVFTGSILSEIE